MGRNRNSLENLIQRTVADGDCLIWQGSLAPDGRYGVASFANKTMRVHRLVFQMIHGPIADDVHVLHRCDTPLCIQPLHLFAGDNAANTADRQAKGRSAVGVGLNHPHRVLDDDRVRAMRCLRSQGVKIKDLAVRFECSKQTVIDVTLGKTWRHVA